MPSGFIVYAATAVPLRVRHTSMRYSGKNPSIDPNYFDSAYA